MTRTVESGTERLLRDELARLATQAPPAEAVRAALARSERSPRPRPIRLAAVAAAVVLVALAVPVVLRLAGPAVPPASSAACCRALDHDLGWAPEGFSEKYREAAADGRVQIRRWSGASPQPQPAGEPASAPEITLAGYTPDTTPWNGMGDKIAGAAEPITVAGRPGMIDMAGDDLAQITWIAESGKVLRLKLTDVPEARATAIRIAGSVRADQRARLDSRIDFGALPEGMVPATAVTQGDSPERSRNTLTARTTAEPERVAIRVSLGPTAAPVAGSTPVPVRGRTGHWHQATPDGGGSITVSLGELGLLEVAALEPLTLEQLVAVTDGIAVDPQPDHSWIGDR